MYSHRHSELYVVMVLIPVFALANWISLDGPNVGRSDDLAVGEEGQAVFLYAADYTHRLYKSTNTGNQWDSIYAYTTTYNPVCVVCGPEAADIVFIGRNATDNTIMKSTNAGGSWATKEYGMLNTSPLCFAIHPDYSSTGNKIVYVGCSSDGGNDVIYKTTNGGDSWFETTLPITTDVQELSISPGSPDADVLLAASDNGVFYTTDGGDSWTKKLDKTPIASVCYVNQNLAFAGQNSGTDGFYKSTDGGSNWTEVGSFSLVRKVCAVSASEIYIAAYGSSGRGIYHTTNGGTNWEYYGRNDGCLCNDSILDIVADPNYSQNKTIYIGDDWTLNKYTASSDSWQEIVEGFPTDTLPRIAIENNYIYSVAFHRRYSGGEFGNVVALWKSTDLGLNWICTQGAVKLSNGNSVFNDLHWPAEPAPSNIIVSPRDRTVVFFSGKVNNPMETSHAHHIFKSDDACISWDRSLNGGEPCDRKNFEISIAQSEPDTMFAAYARDVAGGDIRIMRTLDEGDPTNPNSWVAKTSGIGSEDYSGNIYSLPINPQTSTTVYAGSEKKGVFKTTNLGEQWNSTGLTTGKVKKIVIDPEVPTTIYCAYSTITNRGIKKTTDAGQNWFDSNSGLTYSYITDLEIDPDEPTIVYALGQTNNQSTTNHCYISVDQAGKWIEISAGLPAYTYDIEIDPHNAEKTYASTQAGLYVYNPTFNKSLVSSSDAATACNNGDKMVKSGNDIWLVYESGGGIYMVRSTNNGSSWSKKTELGKGYNPVIAMKPELSGPSGPTLVAVWWAKGTNDTLYFSKYSSYAWGNSNLIVSSTSDYSPPSLTLSDDNYGHVVYVEGTSTVKYTKFDINGQSAPSTQNVGTGSNPSIDFMSSGSNPDIHVAWNDATILWYRSKTGSTWNSAENILANGEKPDIEVVGSSVHVVCEKSSNIQHCYTVYSGGGHSWSSEQINSSLNTSSVPVVSNGSICSWVENINGTNKEIYYSWKGLLGWSSPTNVSGTSDCSDYPHIVHKQTLLSTTIYFVWTENDNALYDISFDDEIMGSGDFGKDDAVPYYLVECGEKTPSPFNVKRDGYTQYGSLFYEQIDNGLGYLEYYFTHLDPEKLYSAEIFLYHRNSENISLELICDDVSIKGITVPSESLVTFEALMPTQIYMDGTISLKLSGENSLSAAMVIYDFEMEDQKGGPQSMGADKTGLSLVKLNIHPNPCHDILKIFLTIPAYQTYSLSLYDILGRKVRELFNTGSLTGVYNYNIDTYGLASGVYFVQLSVENETLIRKVILLD